MIISLKFLNGLCWWFLRNGIGIASHWVQRQQHGQRKKVWCVSPFFPTLRSLVALSSKNIECSTSTHDRLRPPLPFTPSTSKRRPLSEGDWGGCRPWFRLHSWALRFCWRHSSIDFLLWLVARPLENPYSSFFFHSISFLKVCSSQVFSVLVPSICRRLCFFRTSGVSSKHGKSPQVKEFTTTISEVSVCPLTTCCHMTSSMSWFITPSVSWSTWQRGWT